MKHSILALALVGAAAARPTANRLSRREVPQEHAHRDINLAVNKVLNLNNPDKIQDSVFGLLGAKAAAEGAGNIADADCLQQAVADQAFTNAKAAGDVDGMTVALIYRALERNSGSVGLASPPCTSIKAVNPEIAALQQHQDPAGNGAQDLNKQIATVLAQQIAAIGGDPTRANEASTFAPGKLGDPTAKGNTCDDQTDDKGCINTLKLRVDDLSAAEIQAAVAGAPASISAGNATAGASSAAGNASAASGAAAGNANAGGQAAAGKGSGQAAAGKCNAQAAAGKGNAEAAAGKGNAQATAGKGNAQAAAGNANGQAAAGNATAGAANFGSCADPTIKFGIPSDGRNEDAFEPSDLTDFPHGSALNINIISQFICDQLVNKCKANQAAVDTCKQAEAAANGLKAQAAADAFNSALGL